MEDPAADEIAFDFEKSRFFRVIHVDGAVGAISPSSAFIHMSVFSERSPVPKRMVHSLEAGGALGPEISEKRTVRPGTFRELEVDLVFNLETAVGELSPLSHPAMRRVLASFELCLLGGATGRGAEPSR